jgi:glycosyltransferase involved in cell wall biosynthesis
MRVVMLTTFHERCGIATYSEALIAALEANGIDVSVVSPTRKNGDPGWGKQPPRLWRRNRAFGIAAFAAMRAVRERAPDLVHLQVNRSLFSSRFLLDFTWLCRRHGIPIVATLHGRKVGSVGEDFKLFRLLVALRGADLIVHTESHATELARERVHVIPHGVSAAPSRDRTEARRALGIPENAEVISHFGFLVPDKGVNEVIDAIARLRRTSHPSLLYRVAGAIYATRESRTYFDALVATVRRLGVAHAVTMTGDFLSDEALRLELEAASLIVLNYQTGNSQGASGAVRRALSSGRPVAVSVAPVFDDIRAAVHTMSRPIEDELRHLLGSPALLEETAAKARAFAIANDWPEIAHRHAVLYETVLSRKTAR